MSGRKDSEFSAMAAPQRMQPSDGGANRLKAWLSCSATKQSLQTVAEAVAKVFPPRFSAATPAASRSSPLGPFLRLEYAVTVHGAAVHPPLPFARNAAFLLITRRYGGGSP